jgi:aspartyl-tRNA(Asn)/glutamyl-tRNA(Gln) amidotransferase subunit A
LAGVPAMSVPCGFSNGSPVGMQLIGNYFEEEKLLGFAHQYQLDTGWHKKTPVGFE